MRLRNAHLAFVEEHKVVDYLLNASHPDNGGKARFFGSLGFTIDQPESLIDALLAVARDGEVVESGHSEHGEKAIVEGWLRAQTEQGGRRRVRTVWIIDAGKDMPRLVTAYPGREPSA